MNSPFRSVSRLAVAAAVVGGVLATPLAAQAQGGETLIRDTEIEEILHKDADPILRAAGIEPKNVQIVLIGSKDMNAFAAPRVMGVNTGLIVETKTPNELQGVMAHETGHLAAGHSVRSGEMNAPA
jgi:predicted Zn-dependent protease